MDKRLLNFTLEKLLPRFSSTVGRGAMGGIYRASVITLNDNDVASLGLDINGNLLVNVAAGGATGIADTATFTPDTTLGSMIMGVYETTPETLSNDEVAAIGIDVNRNVKTVEQYAAVAEDNVVGVIKTEVRGTPFSITTQTTTIVKSGAGFLYGIEIPTPVASATIKIYDNTAASGTVLVDTITFPAALLSSGPISLILNKTFGTGLTIITAGATMSVSGTYR